MYSRHNHSSSDEQHHNRYSYDRVRGRRGSAYNYTKQQDASESYYDRPFQNHYRHNRYTNYTDRHYEDDGYNYTRYYRDSRDSEPYNRRYGEPSSSHSLPRYNRHTNTMQQAYAEPSVYDKSMHSHHDRSRSLHSHHNSPRNHARSLSPPPTPIPTSPSPDYLRLTKLPSQIIDDPTSLHKLLILDLNGTLLVRKDKRVPYPRPYMPSFREYLFSSQTRRWLDVMVWSSAQPHNVQKMVNRCFFEGHGSSYVYGDSKDKLVAVWARDTLGLSKLDYSRKSLTTKDLSKPWSKLPGSHSALTTFLLDDSPAKVRLQPYNHVCIREYDDDSRLSDIQAKVQHLKRTRECGNKEIITDAAPDQKKDIDATLIVHSDDPLRSQVVSDVKVREEASSQGKVVDKRVADRDMRRKEKKMRKKLESELRRQEGLARLHSKPFGPNAIFNSDRANADANESTPTDVCVNEAGFDEALLAVIGILEEVKTQGNVGAWIRSGGLWAGGTPPPESIIPMSEKLSRASSPTDPEVGESLGSESPNAQQKFPLASPVVLAARTSDDLTSKSLSSPSHSLSSLGPPGSPYSPGSTSSKRQHSFSASDEVDLEEEGHVQKRVKLDALADLSNESEGTHGNAPAGNDMETLTTAPDLKNERVDMASDDPNLPVPSHSSIRDDVPLLPVPEKTATAPKMWFQDEKTFRYWVSRGRAALKEFGIEIRDGVEVI